MSYGYFTGGDPRQFTPDRDMCSQAEIDNHDAACRRWNEAEERGETPEPEPCPSGRTVDSQGNSIHILCTPYGIGVTLP